MTFRIYVYDTNGLHNGPIEVSDGVDMRIAFATAVRRAMEEKREVVVTDTDDYCVFHSQNGEILHPC